MNVTNLSALRTNASSRLTLRAMGKVVGVSAQLISMFENGKRMLGPDNLRRYAKAVGATEEDVRARFAKDAIRWHRAEVVALQAMLLLVTRQKSSA